MACISSFHKVKNNNARDTTNIRRVTLRVNESSIRKPNKPEVNWKEEKQEMIEKQATTATMSRWIGHRGKNSQGGGVPIGMAAVAAHTKLYISCISRIRNLVLWIHVNVYWTVKEKCYVFRMNTEKQREMKNEVVYIVWERMEHIQIETLMVTLVKIRFWELPVSE